MDSGFLSDAEEQMAYEWKARCFNEQGFDDFSVACLLAWDVDPHDSDKLIAKGCPHETALRILKPIFVAA